MTKYKTGELTIKDKIGLCAVAIMGKEVAEQAFLLTHDIKTTNKGSLGVMVSRWQNDEKAKAFIESIRNGQVQTITPKDENDLTTRDGILNQLIASTKQTSGKDSLSGLQTLAKMQGFDKPDERSATAERRQFYLPWVSDCRHCKLMEIYRTTQSEKEEGNNN